MRYRNRRTGEIVETVDPQAIYGLSPRWETLDEAKQAEQQAGGETPPDLSKLRRGELNALAAELGIEKPEDLPNAGEVIEAIEAKQAEQ